MNIYYLLSKIKCNEQLIKHENVPSAFCYIIDAIDRKVIECDLAFPKISIRDSHLLLESPSC